jgi:hypothetical protein
LDGIVFPQKPGLPSRMPLNYLGHQITGNVLLEQVRIEFISGIYESDFFFLDLLNVNFTAVELVSPNANILDTYSSQIKF